MVELTLLEYPDVLLYVDGKWRAAEDGRRIDVVNPATGVAIGNVAHAGIADLDAALDAVARGFAVWRNVSNFDRYKLLRRAADLLRSREAATARLLTMEQGKPLGEAKGEVLFSADVIDWFAEEARRTYGRIVPSRARGVAQYVVKEPIGPVAAFTPWNFPVNQAVRKIAGALAAGCSIVIKGPEETPASCAELVRTFADAGVPAGAVNLVYGTPSEISAHLIPHPTIRKISFTGSTRVGKELAALAGRYMKRSTMELGGHAPAIVAEDADVKKAVRILSFNKFRNAGQICAAPVRFLVQEGVYSQFLEQFATAAAGLRVGNGLEEGTQMGPLANQRGVEAMGRMTSEAIAKGARIHTGGNRPKNDGFYFAPTVLSEVPVDAAMQNEEPFGPVALLSSFRTFEDAVVEANRVSYGLASYVYTRSQKTAADYANAIEAGMVSINHHGVGIPETPFGGVKDSGYGSEGGTEALEGYLIPKFVTQLHE